ncbi:MAG: hypothetical protein A2086_04220 [Spirochaetes bacterium GWD1_27_9]|nr:MAG: hypothetical protein A2Z98_18015 [Spirochaetes bacterium GWB1_27_13]OHD23044.1 MAG: hypothetical protein A2Y34_17845 [Spirochaetes bacterium GWC1_27_15]OHD41364.1 MAG: hypothetical protein A2086_04220 [Spirochaetes bacterium GWD1_27_9]
MSFLMIFMIVCIVLVLFVLISGIRTVQQSTVVIIERLGKFNKILESGINVIIPFVDKVRLINSRVTRYDSSGKTYVINEYVNHVDLRERVFDFPKQNVITRDNVTLEIDALLYFQISDAFKAVYEIENIAMAIEKLTQTTLRNIIGELELDQTLSSRDTINSKLRLILDEATDKWGVKVNRVELKDITPPKEIREAMEKQMRAERERRQIILIAEGDKQAKILTAEGERDKLIAEAEGARQSSIKRAEGDAEAKIKIATAEAEALRLIRDALAQNKLDASQYLVAIKYIQTLQSIGTQQGEKVIFMPYESSALLGSLGSIKEIFKETK